MAKRLTLKAVKDALDNYRTESDVVLQFLRPELPEGKTAIATVSTDFAFVNGIYQVGAYGEIRAGTVEELFCLCEEVPRFGGKQLPKPIPEFSIDLILDVQKEPFIIVTLDQQSQGYLERSVGGRVELGPGRFILTPYAWAIHYTRDEVFGESALTTVRFDERGHGVSLLRY